MDNPRPILDSAAWSHFAAAITRLFLSCLALASSKRS
jgi:hypothetical protein